MCCCSFDVLIISFLIPALHSDQAQLCRAVLEMKDLISSHLQINMESREGGRGGTGSRGLCPFLSSLSADVQSQVHFLPPKYGLGMNKQVNKPILSQQPSCHLLTITTWHPPRSLHLPFPPEDPKPSADSGQCLALTCTCVCAEQLFVL